MTKKPSRLLLNCDLGESYGAWTMGCDQQAMPVIDMANIACGFHASDPDVMADTIRLAHQHQVKIGAHPGYADKQGFGRRSIPHTPEAISHLILYQHGALQGLCQLTGSSVSYIKPHGALYHDMMKQPQVFEAIVSAISQLPQLPTLVIQAGDHPAYHQFAARKGVTLMLEAFADRAYTPSGQLVPRSQPGAVLSDPDQICRQAREIARQQSVTTIDGSQIPLAADTLCVHGDNPQAVAMIARIREALIS